MKQVLFFLAFLTACCPRAGAQANRYDIVIDEIMADPSPSVALPANEWIELKNTSSSPINLSGWRIADASGQSGPLPAYTLKPDSFVIVCTSGAVAAMQLYGSTIAVTSFPSLDNAGDLLYLKSPQNKIIHAVNYSDNWYGNELKKDGGWTLEMMDTRNPCSGVANWTASTDTRGGTPGRKNSVDALNKDQQGPALLRSFAIDSITLTLVFDEPLDSLKAAALNNYTITEGIGTPVAVSVTAPLFDRVLLKLATALQRDKVYTIEVSSITDCAGNVMGEKNKVRTGWASAADSFGLVINEVLFNPRPYGTDYVEIYNRSKKIIDTKNIFIANRNSSGAVSSINALSNESNLFFPGDFLVITTDAAAVKREYVALNPDAFTEPGSMPSFNDDEGDVVLLNAQGKIIDELEYSAKWHFPLIDNAEGVALERISYEAPTQNPDNWHSAATSAGYGTPSYQNSQHGAGDNFKGTITVSPGIISPDNDGQDDYATISYSFPSPGFMADITVYDEAGRVVRYLQQSALCGISGNYRWDGLGEKNRKLSQGIYIVLTEVFNTSGKKKQFKNSIVLAVK